MNLLKAMALSVLVAWPAARLAAQGIESNADGLALMRESERVTKSRTEHAEYRMALLGPDGELVQERRMSLYFRNASASGEVEERTLIRFESPAALQGTGLLVLDEGRSANDLWLYMPANRRLRRLAGAEKSNWFMGTEFTHEDFEDYKLEHYAFSAPREAPCGEMQCRVVDAQPSSESEQAASGYRGKTYWLERSSLYPVLIEYHAKDNGPGKRLETAGLVRIGQYWRPTEYFMVNLANGRRTLLTVELRELDIDLDEHFTSKQYLRGG